MNFDRNCAEFSINIEFFGEGTLVKKYKGCQDTVTTQNTVALFKWLF